MDDDAMLYVRQVSAFVKLLPPPTDIDPFSPEGWSLPLMGIVDGKYRYTQDLLQLSRGIPSTPPYSWPRAPSPLSVQSFRQCLQSHPDRQFAEYVTNGLTNGFRIGYSFQSHKLRTRGRNHPSCMANQVVVSSHITTELAAGRLVGPIPVCFHGMVQTSPMGLVPKGHNTGKWRLIVDLSCPPQFSVNDGIEEDLCSLRYASLDDAVRLISHLGPGCQLVKLDLKDAYRVIPVHPDDQHLLAVSWNGEVYMDRSLPFGLRSAPKIFTAVADAMTWALFSRGIRFVLHYLDDFLLIGPPESREASQAKEIATTVFGELGAPIASQKTEGPSSQITFLGFLVDTEAFQVRLPDEKLARLKQLIQDWQGKHNCTRKELESLLGHLSHAATAVRPGRLFLRQLFGLLAHTSQPYSYIRLNCSIRADLSWWLYFLHEWNGVSLFPSGPPTVHSYSDASGSYGCGAVVPNGAWFNLRWPVTFAGIDIVVKELVPVVLSAVMWGPFWKGQHVLFHIDNMAVVQVVEKLSAYDPRLCHMLRCLYFYSAHFQFTFSATHIPGVQNIAADALSRHNLTLFRTLYPQLQQHTVPPSLVNLYLGQPPDWNSTAWMRLFVASLLPASPRPQ